MSNRRGDVPLIELRVHPFARRDVRRIEWQEAAMSSKHGKLLLDTQTVRSLRARSSLRAGVGATTIPDGTVSGVDKCMAPPDDPPVAPIAAKRPPMQETIHQPGQIVIV